MAMASFSATGRSCRCCRCNRTGTCQGCSCYKSGQLCVSCLPGSLGRCQNQPHGQAAAAPASIAVTTSCLPFHLLQPSQPSIPVNSAPPHPPVSSSQTSSAPCGPISPSLFQPVATSTTIATLPDIVEVVKARIPTLHHVPKGARTAWAKVLHHILTGVSSCPTSLDHWTKLFLAPKCLLASPIRGNRLGWREIQSLVLSRIRHWESGDIAALWQLSLAESRSRSQRHSPSTSRKAALQSSNARRAKHAVEAGKFNKAIRALTFEGLASASEEVFEEMLRKHPQASVPFLPVGPVPEPAEIPEAGVKRALMTLPGNTVPGPSGLRANHLKEAVLCPSPTHGSAVLSALSGLVNCLAAGQAPRSIVPQLCGARCLLSRRKGGGLRPIAVGEVLRRLTSKCLSRAIQHAPPSFYVLCSLVSAYGLVANLLSMQ